MSTGRDSAHRMAYVSADSMLAGEEAGEKSAVGDIQEFAWRVACVGYGAPLASAILLPFVGGYWGLSFTGLLYAAILTAVCLVPVLVQYVRNDDHLRRTRFAAEGLLTRVHQLELFRTIIDAAMEAKGLGPLQIHSESQGYAIYAAAKRAPPPCNHEAELKASEVRERTLIWELKKEKESNKSMRRRLQRLQEMQEGRGGDCQQLMDKQKELLRKKDKLDETVSMERRRAARLQSELQRERNARQVLEAQLQEEKERVRRLEERAHQLSSERDSLKLRQAKKDGGGECAVCMKNKRQLLLRPCNHFCVCAGCLDILQGKCPICRKIIQRTERVYA